MDNKNSEVLQRELSAQGAPSLLMKAILEVRDSGETNMLIYTEVARLMDNRGYRKEAKWVINNREHYMSIIFGEPVQIFDGYSEDSK